MEYTAENDEGGVHSCFHHLFQPDTIFIKLVPMPVINCEIKAFFFGQSS
jgi:hypothetical protein